MTPTTLGKPKWRWLLINAGVVLAVFLTPGLAPAWMVDGGSTATFTSDVNYPNEYIGYNTQGTLNHAGGHNEVDENVYLGYGEAASGTYNLTSSYTGDVAQLSAVNEHIGRAGTGVFNQNGGVNTVSNNLNVGTLSTGTGIYALSGGGTLSATNQYIGKQGTGVFNHTTGSVVTNNTVTANLYLGYASTGKGTYNLEFSSTGGLDRGGVRLEAANQYIGDEGTGTFNHDGGINTITAGLYLGNAEGGTGTYNLRDSGSLSAANQYVGYAGTGTFDQDTSDPITSNTITQGLYLGKTSTGKGTYELGSTDAGRGSAVLTANNEYIGDAGRGIFHHYSSTNAITADLYLGYASTGTGTYNLGDTRYTLLNPQLSATNQFIGLDGSGTFNHERGDNTLTGDLSLGRTSTGTGTYTLWNGNLSADKEFIGYNGSGTFTQNGGSNSIAAGFHLGRNPNGQGTYELIDGNLTAAREFIGNEGTGFFTQTGGKNKVTETLTVANQTDSSGVYNLDGGTLVADTINLKTGGTFSQTGGSLDFSLFDQMGGNSSFIALNLGDSSSSTYNLSGGTLSTDTIELKTGGAFNQTSGTLAFTDFDQTGGNASFTDLNFGKTMGSSASYNQSGGSNTVSGDVTVKTYGTYYLEGGSLGAGNEYVNSGHFAGLVRYGGLGFRQSGGTNTLTGSLFLNSESYYKLSGSDSVLSVGQDLDVGDASDLVGEPYGSLFSQTDGTATVSGSLYLGNIAATFGTYELAGGILSAATEFIGNEGTGVFTQSGGTNTVSGTLIVANQVGSSGAYYLNGGSLSAAGEDIQGNFSHSSGRNTVSGNVTVGYTYYLEGGSLAAADQYVNSGYYGYIVRDAGQGFLQSGGTNTLTGSLFLNSVSHYKLDGSDSVLQVGQDLDVGDDHLAFDILYGCLFSQTDGTATVTGNLYLGNVAATLGKYELAGGSLSADKEFIGYDGIGTFTQTGGSNSIAAGFHLGRNPTGQGTYELSDGTLLAAREFIGNEGTGAFTQTGGRNTATEKLNLAYQEGSSGAYNLEGGTLWANNINLRSGGAFQQTGGSLDFLTFDQLGGTATFTELSMGEDIVVIPGGPDVDPESSTYSLQDGSLSAPTINLKTGGTFNQSGGTLDFSQFDQTGGHATFTDLYLGINPDSSSSYNLSNTGLLDVGGTLKVGGEANGYFTQSGGTLTSGSLVINSHFTGFANSFTQSGGSHTVNEDLTVGVYGTYYLQGGSLGAGDEYVKTGYRVVFLRGAGAGFRQSGGTNALTGSLFLNSESFYELKGAASVLQVGQDLDVGDASTGILGDLYGCLFSQTNGNANIAGTLYLGKNGGTLGTYELNGGSLSASQEIIGENGNGIFNQEGGKNTVTDTLTLAKQSGSTGTFNLGGGILAAENEDVGDSGAGTFTQTGGTHAVNSLLSLGYSSSGSGAFILSGGSLAATNEGIGHSGTGSFNQDAGLHSVLGNLYLGRNSGSSGTYTLSGGTQTVSTLIMGENRGSRGTYNLGGGSLSALNEFIGLNGNATFTQTGGTHSVTSNLFLGLGTNSNATYNLEGGSLSAGTIQINSTGTFNLTGVDTTLTTTVTGNVVNAGTIKTTNADVTWDGTFTTSDGGVYLSDPSTQTFTDFMVEAGGCVMASSQDTFIIKNNFETHCTSNTMWDTDQAVLQFVAGTYDSHNLYITGADLGPTPSGYDNNYAWGTFLLGETDEYGNIVPGTEQEVHLYDGNDTAGGALYVGEIQGLLFGSPLITNIYGNGLNIYYDPTLPGNAYLGGLTYDLQDGGQLMPTPVPASVLLLGSGLLGLGLLCRWRRRLS